MRGFNFKFQCLTSHNYGQRSHKTTSGWSCSWILGLYFYFGGNRQNHYPISVVVWRSKRTTPSISPELNLIISFTSKESNKLGRVPLIHLTCRPMDKRSRNKTVEVSSIKSHYRRVIVNPIHLDFRSMRWSIDVDKGGDERQVQQV